MSDEKYTLICAIVDRGYGGDVMDVARSAGAEAACAFVDKREGEICLACLKLIVGFYGNAGTLSHFLNGNVAALTQGAYSLGNLSYCVCHCLFHGFCFLS